MKALYYKNSPVHKLRGIFSAVFTNETAPTREPLIDMMMSVIALNGFQSVQYNYEHFIQEISGFRLKSYYYALNESALDIDDWTLAMIHTALSLIPKNLRIQTIRMSNKVETNKKCGIIKKKSKRKCQNGRINGNVGVYRR